MRVRVDLIGLKVHPSFTCLFKCRPECCHMLSHLLAMCRSVVVMGLGNLGLNCSPHGLVQWCTGLVFINWTG